MVDVVAQVDIVENGLGYEVTVVVGIGQIHHAGVTAQRVVAAAGVEIVAGDLQTAAGESHGPGALEMVVADHRPQGVTALRVGVDTGLPL